MGHPESVSPEALRAFMRLTRESFAAAFRRVVSLERTAATPPPAVITDNVPRWVRIVVPHTLYTPSVGFTSADVTIATFPPGAVWTVVRIDVTTPYVSTGAIWRMLVRVPVGGSGVGGTPKNPDVTTPDAIAQLTSDQVVTSDPAGVCDVVLNLDSTFTDTCDQLTDGEVAINMLVSVPGSTANLLPSS